MKIREAIKFLKNKLFPIFRKIGYWPIFLALFLFYAIVPIINKNEAIEITKSSPEFRSAIDSTRSFVENIGYPAKEERNFIKNTSQFSQVIIPYRIYWTDYEHPPKLRTEIWNPIVSLRIDQVILFGSLSFVIFYTFSTFFSKSRKIEIETNESISEKNDINKNPELVASNFIQDKNIESTINAQQVFIAEVKKAEGHAAVLFRRSTYLLTSGVLMAFIGVAIFHATLPDYISESSDKLVYVTHAIRAGGMLIFIEAIAWFLLKQYRSLIEDFKSFHRVYMKRANYLAAITIIEKPEIRGEDIIVITALLGEDFSGKIRAGESTEALENLKNEGENPVFKLARDLIERLLPENRKNQ
ncbi:hypothetical protein [Delftia acidovorans]